MRTHFSILLTAVVVSACATTDETASLTSITSAVPSSSPQVSEQMQELFDQVPEFRAMYADNEVPVASEADAALMAAESKIPLGSPGNPVRTAMPGGQREYLNRLRCSDGRRPNYYRAGNVGPGAYGTIVDLYVVDCGRAAPGEVQIHMDMYHRHIESEAVPGFQIMPHGSRTLPAT